MCRDTRLWVEEESCSTYMERGKVGLEVEVSQCSYRESDFMCEISPEISFWEGNAKSCLSPRSRPQLIMPTKMNCMED